jgi:hypothetical protein
MVTALLFLAFALSLGGLDHLSELYNERATSLFRWYGFAVIVTGVVLLWVDSMSVAWSGMFCGLMFRTSQHARGYSMLIAFAAPFLLFVTVMPVIAQSAFARQLVQDAGFFALLLAAGFFVVTWDVAVILSTRRWIYRSAHKRLTGPEIHARGREPFFRKPSPNCGSKAGLIIRNVAKAP